MKARFHILGNQRIIIIITWKTNERRLKVFVRELVLVARFGES